ncbi:DUF4142 domain-containing protein [Niabella sp. CC-SYL272]|uniref:DUF4142 domain-containing protein n=1 Tax=Niabella agricola TaxID=2891571 RepID=UPI001F257189|nr:DUF4142 domain-containing protein [Niabella agricola]MCF3108349.1 DUF4142 domain-containing protein [Niabella agricola]
MKQSIFSLLVCVVMVLGAIATACNTGPDSRKAAQDSNEVKFNKSDTANPSTATLEKDADFAVTAADGGRMEVELGQLAQRNGQRQEVKDFGRMMEKDHSAANSELKALAAQKNISLPDSLSEGMKRKYDRLRDLKGAAFDKEYIKLMVADHQEDVDAFRHYTDKGADQNLVQWAKGKLPVLETHLQHAQQVDSLLKH